MKYEDLENLSTENLYEYVTQKDSSVIKHKARDIIEIRRMKPLVDAAKKSASAAAYSACAAFLSAIITIITLLNFLNK